MEDRALFLCRYLLFFSLWTAGLFAVRRLLGRLARRFLNIEPGKEKRQGSLESKLKGYLLFQAILILSAIFSRGLYLTFIAAIFITALSEFVYQTARGGLKPAPKAIWIVSGVSALVVAALSYSRLSFLTGYTVLIFLFFVLSVSDAFSQMVGECLKGPRLFPRISPNKTWCGFIGGLVFSVLGAVSYYYVFRPRGLSLTFSVLSSVFIFFSAFIGDAAASALKRRVGIKDFSSILGAQGGMLDRLDSMVLLGPIAVVLLTIFGGGYR